MEEKKEKKIGTIIKTFQGKRTSASGSEYDVIIIWYRDENGVKRTICYDRPEVSYYLIKDKNSKEALHPPLYISKDLVEKHTTYSDLLYRDIAVNTGSLQYYDQVLASKGQNAYVMKNLFKHNYVYDADMDLNDRYIAKFHEEFKPDINYKLHKGYFDIEVDLMSEGWKKDSKGNVGYMGFPAEDEAPCPINIITLIDGKSKIIYSYVVRNPLNDLLIDFEKNVERHRLDLIEEIKREDGVDITNSVVHFYNAEEEAIEAFFNKVHELDFDIMSAWNIRYDLVTIMNRLTKLYGRKLKRGDGGDLSARDMMENTVCDLKYSVQQTPKGQIFIPPKVWYKSDKKAKIGDRIDSFLVLDGIVWVDQMLYYAVAHSAGGKKMSYALNSIAYDELGKEKLPMLPGQTIKNLPWKNFVQFYRYNVRDVNLLFLLEEKLLDFDTLQRLSEITNTRKEKVYSSSVSMPNFVNRFAIESDHVMNCNQNASYDSKFKRDGSWNNHNFDDLFREIYQGTRDIVENNPEYVELFNKKDKFGALVSDPNLNQHVGVEIIKNSRSMFLYRLVCDQDLSSLYPSIIRAFNLDASTMIGKFFLRDDSIKKRLKEKYDYYGCFKLSEKDDSAASEEDDEELLEESEKNAGETNDLGPTIVDSLISQNWSRIGEKYFMLPSLEETFERLDNYIKERDK